MNIRRKNEERWIWCRWNKRYGILHMGTEQACTVYDKSYANALLDLAVNSLPSFFYCSYRTQNRQIVLFAYVRLLIFVLGNFCFMKSTQTTWFVVTEKLYLLTYPVGSCLMVIHALFITLFTISNALKKTFKFYRC